jgi:hypothetical protein
MCKSFASGRYRGNVHWPRKGAHDWWWPWVVRQHNLAPLTSVECRSLSFRSETSLINATHCYTAASITGIISLDSRHLTCISSTAVLEIQVEQHFTSVVSLQYDCLKSIHWPTQTSVPCLRCCAYAMWPLGSLPGQSDDGAVGSRGLP